MAGIQLSGLASGFDWKSFVDQVMEIERSSVTRLEVEQMVNTRQIDALNTLNTKVSALRNATAALKNDGLYNTRSATSSDAGWTVRADGGALLGDYTFDVTRLATASRLTGAADRGAPLAPNADVSELLISDLPMRTRLTEGFFTVNGAQVEVALTDSLQDVFDRISSATGGAVTAAYDPLTDGISLQSGSEIVLGASNDTANFTYALGLSNNGSGEITGRSGLGTTDIHARLNNARLQNEITAVDGEGAGQFSINGVEIHYNLQKDSINDIIGRINNSSAGVHASFDATTDGFVLANTRTGDSGMTVTEAAGGLMDALGITTGATLTRGTDAQFTLNNGSVLTSATQSLDASVHGIAGLTVTANRLGSTTVSVAADSAGVRTAINDFIAKYNDVQDYIEEQTKITTGGDSVKTATLSSNREVNSWTRELRSLAFAALDEGTSTFTRLESLGIDFRSGTSKLEVKDEGRLTAALQNSLASVQDFFASNRTGFASRMENYVDRLTGFNATSGYLSRQTTQLQRSNTALDAQIERLERQLDQRRALMESGFIAMETAQQRINAMQDQLARAFPDTSNNKK